VEPAAEGTIAICLDENRPWEAVGCARRVLAKVSPFGRSRRETPSSEAKGPTGCRRRLPSPRRGRSGRCGGTGERRARR